MSQIQLDSKNQTILSIQEVQARAQAAGLTDRLQALADRLANSGDHKQAEKLRDLIGKWTQGDFAIAFCGHFSAGKSSMINALLGAQILPSSPIPTSANVVSIRGGEPSAVAYLTDGDAVEFDLATELDKIKNYAVDGNQVERIDITHPSPLLADHVSVMDTPGIDSTDDAHKVATESALHLADVVFYMMDYNHVQSELNFSFTKMLKDRGKPVYLIVNQIDKHMDFELDFEEYRDSVVEGFATWGIEPDGLYFTSLMEPDHDENMFDQLQEKMQQLFADKDKLLLQSVVSSAYALLEEHRKWQGQQQQEEKQRLEAQLEQFEDAEQVLQEGAEASAQWAKLTQVPEELAAKMKKEIQTLLDNAKITPYQTTERAGAYLQTRKQGFKVGFLFSANKTQQEKEHRLQALVDDVTDKVQANIDWHLRDLLVKIPEAHGVRDEAYARSVQEELSVPIDGAWLAALVKEAGLSSEEYMYQYAKDIAAAIKERYRQEALRFVERAVALSKQQAEQQGARLQEQIKAAEQLRAAKQAMEQLGLAERAELAAGIRLLIGEEA